MTVTAQQGQIVDSSGALTAHLPGLYVMAFDEALAKITVKFFEVKLARPSIRLSSSSSKSSEAF
jgi:hypothetical protein